MREYFTFGSKQNVILINKEIQKRGGVKTYFIAHKNLLKTQYLKKTPLLFLTQRYQILLFKTIF